MRTTIGTLLVAATIAATINGQEVQVMNFQRIPLNTPTYSNEDPLGVAAISNAAEKAEEAYTEAAKKYEKPVGGIPKEDLSSDVQTTLDNAVQTNEWG